MIRKILSLAAAVMLAFVPVHAQSSARNAEEAAPKTGIRFVVCSARNAKLPTPLYYQAGKEFKPVRIGGRTPSQRIKPINGVVNFWEQDPSGGADDTKGKAKAVSELPPPALSVNIPASVGSKGLCIVIPGDSPSKSQTFFMSESEFPNRGIHVVNFSPTELQMTISKKGDFTDKKVSSIKPFKRSEGITKNNSWSYPGGENGEIVAFKLTAANTAAKGGAKAEPVRIKTSKFIVSDRQSQITVIVKDPDRDAYRMLSVQVAD